ncbi:FYDLN acid domain-containing protein [Novosphingobium sp. MW5]|nr:FYDLN acid domain-containing protein [Novosphingobium sp. MW5]
MAKAEWGAKHGCPKCGTRFYDLGKDDPITCIECGYAWHAEPVLKSKQPIPFEEVQKDPAQVADADLAEEDIDIDEDGDSPDNDVDLGGDDDLGVAGVEGDDDEN